MDSIDRAILRQLQDDGRLTNVELAERVRLSPSPCLRRVRALEQAGVIRGYHADLDPAAVGRGFEVTVHIELTLKDRATVEAFEAGIAALDEACAAALEMKVPEYRFVRRYLERCPQAPLSLRQIDPLIRNLMHYRDLIQQRTQESCP